MKVLKFISTTVILVSIFALSINMYTVWMQYTEIKKVCSVAISHGQKNGGITSKTVQLLNDLLDERDLKDKIAYLDFYPGIDIPVQKREKFSIVVKPYIKLKVPFAGEIVYETSDIEVSGYSHKYFK
jgi:hypothetical protein